MRIPLTVALLCSTACSTMMLSTWKKPGQGPLQFQKLAVIAPVKDAAMRRSIEDQLVTELGPGRATATYELLGGAIDQETLKATLSGQGYDAAVAVRIASVDKEADYVSAPYSYGFGAWPYYEGGYVDVNTYVRVETHIYSLPAGELLFSSMSRTVNPTNVRELVDETVKAVRSELEKEGLLVKPVARLTPTRTRGAASRR